MKKLIPAFILLVFFTTTYGQETTITIPEINKDVYLKKSKRQKTAAWILLGTGSLAALSGAVEVNPDYGESTNRPLLLIGGLVMAGASVDLFIASGRNKKKAAAMSLSNQFVPQMNNGHLVNRPVPSLQLKISLKRSP